MKTHDNKDDFIQKLAMMTPAEINEYIKQHGKPPKMTYMCHILTEEEIKRGYQ